MISALPISSLLQISVSRFFSLSLLWFPLCSLFPFFDSTAALIPIRSSRFPFESISLQILALIISLAMPQILALIISLAMLFASYITLTRHIGFSRHLKVPFNRNYFWTGQFYLCHRSISFDTIPDFSFMDSRKITYISELDVLKEEFIMKVRVLCMWKQHVFTNPMEVFSIELLLIDEKGSRIQGNIMKRCIPKFNKLLQENCDYYIQNPMLGTNSTTYKYVDNPHKLNLVYDTKVTKCIDFVGKFSAFSFISFRSILDKTVSQDVTIDIIGQVVRSFEMESFAGNKAKETKKITVEIQDLEGLKIYVTLWDDFAMQMHKYLSANQDGGLLIIVLQFGKLKFFKDRPYVSNSYVGSRLFINHHIKEITAFKKSLIVKTTECSSSTHYSMSSPIIYSMNEEFLKKTDFINIAEIQEICEEKTVVILGTVKAVRRNVPWYYLACDLCNRKVKTTCVLNDMSDSLSPQDDKLIFECHNLKCKDKVISTVPRFMISLRVQDSTGLVSLTMFDRDANKILKTSAKDLLRDDKENSHMDMDFFST